MLLSSLSQGTVTAIGNEDRTLQEGGIMYMVLALTVKSHRH